jgi:hypothetical protein
MVGPIACCLLLSWGVFAAPRKDNPPPVYYHASTLGDKLVYEQRCGDELWDYVLEVIDAPRKGAGLIVTVRGAEGDRATESWRYEVSDKGVYRVGEGDAELESPECYLRLPFKKGGPGRQPTHTGAKLPQSSTQLPARRKWKSRPASFAAYGSRRSTCSMG